MGVFENIYLENAKKKREELEIEFLGTSQTIYNSAYTTVVSTFDWEDLPKTTLRFLPERFLFYWGMFAMYEEKGIHYIYPCTPSGSLLDNGEYDKYMLYTLNGRSFIKDREEIVLCYNNSRNLPSYIFVSELSEKMSYALSAVDSALERSMLPYIASCSNPDELKEITELYDKRKCLSPFLATLNEAFKNENIKIHKLFDNRETDVLALWDIYVRYRNLFYTTFGINNVEIQKKERLTEAEGSGNDEITRFTLITDMLNCRKWFCEEAKEKFGSNINISINRNSSTVYELSLTNEEKIHNMNLDFLKGINTNIGGDNSENRDNEG